MYFFSCLIYFFHLIHIYFKIGDGNPNGTCSCDLSYTGIVFTQRDSDNSVGDSAQWTGTNCSGGNARYCVAVSCLRLVFIP